MRGWKKHRISWINWDGLVVRFVATHLIFVAPQKNEGEIGEKQVLGFMELNVYIYIYVYIYIW